MKTNIDTAKDAIKAIVSVTVDAVKQENRRGVTKKPIKEERKAVKEILFLLLGETPKDEDIDYVIKSFQ